MTMDLIPVSRPLRLGIIGGGQLGKMIAQNANRMSIRTVILDPSEDCPAAVEAHDLIVASFKDDEAIYELSRRCDVMTYEIELASSAALHDLEKKGFLIFPSPRILSLIQDKLTQKTFLREQKIPVPDFVAARSSGHLREVCADMGFPVVVKARKDSYDGRGNFVVDSDSSIEEAMRYFSGKELMAERFVPFAKELSVMVARNRSGQVETFPVVENIHDKGILQTTIAPARVGKTVQQKARKLATKVINAFGGIGIFGVEMFLTKQEGLLINEVAPRPHNSGHYSNEACSVSQFEQHIRAVLDLPLVEPELVSPAAMINILGPEDLTGDYRIEGTRRALAVDGARLYIYGKKASQPRRKLGHITATGRSPKVALERALKCRKMLAVVGMQEIQGS